MNSQFLKIKLSQKQDNGNENINYNTFSPKVLAVIRYISKTNRENVENKREKNGRGKKKKSNTQKHEPHLYFIDLGFGVISLPSQLS